LEYVTKAAPVPDYANPLVNVAFEQMVSLDKEGGDSVAVSLINSLVPDFQRDPIKSLRPVETDFPFIKGSNSRVLSMDFCGLSEITFGMKSVKNQALDSNQAA
jgi:hypothetical protein